MSEAAHDRYLSKGQKLTYSLGALGQSTLPAVLVSWLAYYYAPPEDAARGPLVGYAAFAAVTMLGRIADALADPLVGYYSDRTRSAMGRRKPWVLIGAPLLSLSFLAVWFPPTAEESLANAAWLGATLSLFWIFFTVVVAPYLALLPEITPSNKERVVVSTTMGYVELVGNILALVVLGFVVTWAEETSFSAGPLKNGYQLTAVIVALVALGGYLASVSMVREKSADELDPVPFDLLEAVKVAFQNPACVPYLAANALLRLGLNTVIIAIPYLATTVMGEKEDTAATIQGAVILLAGLLFPLVAWLGMRLGKRRIFIVACLWFAVVMVATASIGSWPVFSPLTQGFIIFPLAAFPAAVIFVLPRPMIADVIDLDAERTGYRREAIYNGVEGLVTKLAEGGSRLLTMGLFAAFGTSAEAPYGILLCGPAAAVGLVLAAWAMSRYPIKD